MHVCMSLRGRKAAAISWRRNSLPDSTTLICSSQTVLWRVVEKSPPSAVLLSCVTAAKRLCHNSQSVILRSRRRRRIAAFLCTLTAYAKLEILRFAQDDMHSFNYDTVSYQGVFTRVKPRCHFEEAETTESQGCALRINLL